MSINPDLEFNLYFQSQASFREEREGARHYLISDCGAHASATVTDPEGEFSGSFSISFEVPGNLTYPDLTLEKLKPLAKLKDIPAIVEYVEKNLKPEVGLLFGGKTPHLFFYALATNFKRCLMRTVTEYPQCYVVVLKDMVKHLERRIRDNSPERRDK